MAEFAFRDEHFTTWRKLMKSIPVGLTGLLVSSVSAFGQSSTALSDEQPSEVIHLVERAQAFSVQDFGAPGPSIGDRLVFTSDLYDLNNRLVGRDGADCVTVRIDNTKPSAEQQLVQCTLTVQLPRGQITFQGLAQGTSSVFAVTGGSGAYYNVHGQALAVDRVPLSVADVTITLYRD